MYRHLDIVKISDTVVALEGRIGTRFPDSSLRQVAKEIQHVSGEVEKKAKWLSTPCRWVRACEVLCIILFLGLEIGAIVHAMMTKVAVFSSLAEFFQGFGAFMDNIVFVGIALFFFSTLETRMKRKKAIEGLNELRSLAHVIDMHQLSKSPDSTKLDNTQLKKYLGYCSELLSCLSNIAAIYAQSFNDEPVLNTVNDLEELAGGLSRNIWQKIMIIDTH